MVLNRQNDDLTREIIPIGEPYPVLKTSPRKTKLLPAGKNPTR